MARRSTLREAVWPALVPEVGARGVAVLKPPAPCLPLSIRRDIAVSLVVLYSKRVSADPHALYRLPSPWHRQQFLRDPGWLYPGGRCQAQASARALARLLWPDFSALPGRLARPLR